MKKTKLDIPILLPDIHHEKDLCVHRLNAWIAQQKGVEKVHVTNENNKNAQLCIHYDSEVISLEKIGQLTQNAGAKLTRRYGHLLLQTDGVRHQRHAHQLAARLLQKKGIMEAAVSLSGVVSIEFDKETTTQSEVEAAIQRAGLSLTEKLISSPPDEATKPGKKEKHAAEESHVHGAFLGENTELIFAASSGLLLVLGFGLSFVDAVPDWVSFVLYTGAYFFCGFFSAKEAVETVLRGGFEIDFLMLVAAIGAAVLGEWAEGALLLALFSLGHAMEHFAMNKARKSIAALAKLSPETALVRRGGKMQEVPVEKLKIGEIIIVRPGSKIAADGVVVAGKSSVNQAPITGESMPVDKEPLPDPSASFSSERDIPPQHRVFAGTLNGFGSLEIKVLKEAANSTLSRLVQLVSEAEAQQSPTQLFTKRFERIFVPILLSLTVLLLFAFLVIDETFGQSFYRAMAVLVAASPCALAIGTPAAVLSGVARAARSGILIKGGRPLEDLGGLTAIAFDKTGTLTTGHPRLTNIIRFGDITEQELLSIVVSVEQLSDHPLAKAIVRDGKEKLKGQVPEEAQNLESVLGKGIRATLKGDSIYIGNRELFVDLLKQPIPPKLDQQLSELEAQGNTSMLVRRNDTFIGILSVMDTPRKEAKQVLEKLKILGIRRMIMLTGDNQRVADSIARQTGLTDAWGSLLPEEKVAAILKLKQQEDKVAMVGDGVNDAPAMANSTVGVAMGAAGSDVALETADIALLADRLDRLPFAIGLSRKAKAIIKQNLWISLGMVAVLIPLTISGIASIGPAVVAHEGSTVVVVLNALRLLRYDSDA